MKKLAYLFGLIGSFCAFSLVAFELIMISVNTFSIRTMFDLYTFFIITLFNFVLLAATYLKNNQKLISTNFNLNDNRLAMLFLGLSVLSIALLLDSNCYNADSSQFLIKLQWFLATPSIYLPLIPNVLSGIFFITDNIKDNFHHKKKVNVVSH